MKILYDWLKEFVDVPGTAVDVAARLSVRGKEKARAMLLWFALAHNMLRALALQQAARVAAT